MRKLLTLIAVFASLLLGACSRDPVVNRLPWVYRIEIQQGNVIEQDQVNQLREGMSRDQVAFILGTPLIRDPFHADRWDYYFEYRPGSKGKGEPRRDHLAVFFEEDALSRVEGTLVPDPDAGEPPSRLVTVEVPPQEPEDIGLLTRLWRWLTFRSAAPEDSPGPPSKNNEVIPHTHSH